MPFPALIPAITAAAGFFGRNRNKIGNIAGAAAPILGGLAGGRARGTQIEGDQAISRDALRQRMYEAVSRNMLDRSRLGAERAGFEANAPNLRFDQALRGGLAANLQDVSASGPARVLRNKIGFSGGLRPSAIGPQGREAGSRLARLAFERMGKDAFDLPDLPTPPQLSAMPKSGFGDKLLGAAGPAMSFLGGLNLGGGADYVGPAVNGGATPPPGIGEWLPESPALLLPDRRRPDLWGVHPPDMRAR